MIPFKAIKAFVLGLSWPALALIATVLFYEGVFFLNWWPLNQIPYAGPVIEGEVSRRIAAAEFAEAKKALRRARAAENALAEMETATRENEREILINNGVATKSLRDELQAAREANPAPVDVETFTDELALANDTIAQLQAANAALAADRDIPKCAPQVVVKTVRKSCVREKPPSSIVKSLKELR